MSKPTEGHGAADSSENAYYYDSYAHLQIHREMLQDKTRTGSYQKAIMEHAEECFKDKVVLDVGCGTGILSFFAAKAGAKRVYAVDASDIVGVAASICESNGFGDVVKVVRGTVEDVVLPGLADVGGGVDVIISEWMGYLLIYESMLRSVIVARDRFLKPDGLMFPSHAKLYMTAYSDTKYFGSYVDYWDDVYGVNMGVVKPRAMQWMAAEPYVEALEPTAIRVSAPVCVLDIDCKTATADEVEHVDSAFKLNIAAPAGQLPGPGGTVPVHGFASWFDCMFTGHGGLAGPATVTLSTAPAVDKPVPGPWAPPEPLKLGGMGLTDVNPVTHWKQVRSRQTSIPAREWHASGGTGFCLGCQPAVLSAVCVFLFCVGCPDLVDDARCACLPACRRCGFAMRCWRSLTAARWRGRSRCTRTSTTGAR
jgi:type I protein arginine methyltransferase